MIIDTRVGKELTLYIKIRNAWCESEEGRDSAWEGEWEHDFRAMLARYDASIIRGESMSTESIFSVENDSEWLKDGVGTVIGLDYIVFDTEESYVRFLLSWA